MQSSCPSAQMENLPEKPLGRLMISVNSVPPNASYTKPYDMEGSYHRLERRSGHQSHAFYEAIDKFGIGVKVNLFGFFSNTNRPGKAVICQENGPAEAGAIGDIFYHFISYRR